MPRPKIKNQKSKIVLDRLRAYESRNVTFIEPDGSWPIIWERAKGVYVWDADGKKYLDLTAAFGVASAGHANARVVRAGQKQMALLLHAMGDVHPHALKAQLAERLSQLTFERWTAARASATGPQTGTRGKKLELRTTDDNKASRRGVTGKTIFCNSGFEAVEAALKTVLLATGKPGVIAFQGAYHGVGYGTLNTTHREHFRSPFLKQLREFGIFVPFPNDEPAQNQPSQGTLEVLEPRIRRLLSREDIGAILVEPIQVRGGINVPPPGFLPLLRQLCDQYRVLLVLDEIYTGLGRTGKWFACEHSAIVPDLICLGKALTGGFPLSACVGRADLMDAAWPPSSGEAIHTSTFLGHPVGCAMALAQTREIEQQGLVHQSAVLGQFLLSALASLNSPLSRLTCSTRGIGLLAGVELSQPDGSPATDAALRIIKVLLQQGFILLPEGEHSNVISFSPPLIISKKQLETVVNAFRYVLGKLR